MCAVCNMCAVFAPAVEVRVVSLGDFDLSALKKILVNSAVGLQRGVDVRSARVANLYKSGFIGQSSYNSIVTGRKRHEEVNSKGAIGLAIANRLALARQMSVPLLLLEDDFVIKDEGRFVAELQSLYDNIDSFDLAVFGANHSGHNEGLKQASFMPSGWYLLDSGRFMRTHCVLFSAEGRQKIVEYLRREPVDMQIDGLYSFWAETRGLRVVLQAKRATVVQRPFRLSSIQTDVCFLCDVDARNPLRSRLVGAVVATTAIVTLAAFLGGRSMVAKMSSRRRVHPAPRT